MRSAVFWVAVRDAILWLLVSVALGMLQMWLRLGYMWFNDMEILTFEYLKSGVVLFFCSGIIVASSFDVWLDDEISKKSRSCIIFHLVLPLLFLLAIATSYVSTIDAPAATLKVRNFQLTLLALSLFYSTVSKVELGQSKLRSIMRRGEESVSHTA